MLNVAIPLRSVLYSISLLITMGIICLPTSATVVAVVRGSERTELQRLIRDSNHSICIRCSCLSDPMILRSLAQVSRHGIYVRVITDILTPNLKRRAFDRSPHFAIHMTSASDKGSFFPLQKSYALLDTTIAWYGVKKWSPKSWIGESQVIIDSRPPNKSPTRDAFEQLWQRSNPVVQE